MIFSIDSNQFGKSSELSRNLMLNVELVSKNRETLLDLSPQQAIIE